MTIEDVRAVIRVAREHDPAAGLALRLAAVAGLRRAELAALRWDDLEGERLMVDKSVEVVRTEERGRPDVRVAPTKTANRRQVGLDAETIAEVEAQRQVREKISPFTFSLTDGRPSPDRIGWWWTRLARRPASIRNGGSTI